MKIVLVRHGFSQGNLEKTYSGWTDVELTQEGIDELKQFKVDYDYPETDRYISSSLVRCLDTFKVLFGDEKELYQTSDELRELYFGDYENLKSADCNPHYFEGFPENNRTANGETMTEFTYRIVSKLERILKSLQDDGLDSATLVCHSGVIKAMLVFLGHLPFTEFTNIVTPNGLGFVLDIDYDAVRHSIVLNSYEAIKLK